MTARSRVLAAVLGAAGILVVIAMAAVLFGEGPKRPSGVAPIANAPGPEASPTAPGAPAKVTPGVSRIPESVDVTTEPVIPPPVVPETDPDHPLRKQIDQLVAEFLDVNAPTDPTSLALDRVAAKMEQIDAILSRLALLGEEAVPHLLSALAANVNPAVKIFLARGLVRMATPSADDALKTVFLTVPNMAVKTAVINELRTREGPEVGALTAGLFEAELSAAQQAQRKGIPDRSGGIRAALLRNLARLTPGDFLPAITEAAKSDPDPSVRAQAVDLLSKCPDPLAVSVLQRMLNEEKTKTVLQSAIVSYARLTRDASIPTLEGIMRRSDADTRVKASVVYALGQVGGPRAEQMLQSIATYETDPKIRERAAGTLASLRRNAASDKPAIDASATIPVRPATEPGGGEGGATDEGGGEGALPTLPGGARSVPPRKDG